MFTLIEKHNCSLTIAYTQNFFLNGRGQFAATLSKGYIFPLGKK